MKHHFGQKNIFLSYTFITKTILSDLKMAYFHDLSSKFFFCLRLSSIFSFIYYILIFNSKTYYYTSSDICMPGKIHLRYFKHIFLFRNILELNTKETPNRYSKPHSIQMLLIYILRENFKLILQTKIFLNRIV